MKECPHADCTDKDSLHYFIFHMTDQEAAQRFDAKSISHFEFNVIRKKNASREQKSIKHNVTFRKDS